MKKFAVIYRDIELDVYADTEEEARKRALPHFISQLENDLLVCDGSVRTERCDVCQYTYEPCWIVHRDGEQLCEYCYFEKYRLEEPNLNDIDIPF